MDNMSYNIYITKRHIPRKPCICPVTQCIYNGYEDDNLGPGICSNPYINSGNGDAECYRWRARRIVEMVRICMP